MNPLALSTVSNRISTPGMVLPPPINYTNITPNFPIVTTPIAPIVRRPTINLLPQFPPQPVTTLFSTNSIIPSQQTILTPPTIQTSTVMYNQIQPSTNVVYANPPMPTRIPIPGFSFPEVYLDPSQDPYFMQAGISMIDRERLPIDASFADMSTKIVCPRCGHVAMTNVQLELGCASYFWCFTLLPLACTGLCCLCLPQCKDRIHYCNCGEVVGYHRNAVC